MQKSIIHVSAPGMTLNLYIKIMQLFYLTDEDITSVRQVEEFIKKSLKRHYTIAYLAQKVMLPEKKLKAAYKELYGKGLYTHLRELRLTRAKDLLIMDVSIHKIAQEVGYRNESSFSTAFSKWFGVCPRTFKHIHKPSLS